MAGDGVTGHGAPDWVPAGTPSDQLPAVLATGRTDVRVVFVSMSAREPDGRDEEYLVWHALDHRPEQYRLAALRGSLRLVSTPACRAARAAADARYEAVDHVMSYLFSDRAALEPFLALGRALGEGGRMPLRLPSVETAAYDLAGTVAAPRAAVGADVIPWRPARGVYLLIERGRAAADALAAAPGVAGAWWYAGSPLPPPWRNDTTGLQITYCYLDGDPVAAAEELHPVLEKRWAGGDVTPLLAAPFHAVMPFEFGRYLP
ncbi:MAG TPA: hypothetical protein VFH50_01760 [Acidimicrobiales bacterium]|nr:hypothetical protein [Acidimicrobiales bacterium]